jgi:hypothetical protein
VTFDLTGLDWVVAGAAAVSLYVLASMWLTSRRPAPADTKE